MVRARRDQVGAVGAEGAIPNPALVGLEGRFKRKRPRLTLDGEVLVALDVVRVRRINGPDARVVVGGTGC